MTDALLTERLSESHTEVELLGSRQKLFLAQDVLGHVHTVVDLVGGVSTLGVYGQVPVLSRNRGWPAGRVRTVALPGAQTSDLACLECGLEFLTSLPLFSCSALHLEWTLRCLLVKGQVTHGL